MGLCQSRGQDLFLFLSLAILASHGDNILFSCHIQRNVLSIKFCMASLSHELSPKLITFFSVIITPKDVVKAQKTLFL